MRRSKVVREKQLVTYKGTPKELSAVFSAETLQARRKWHNIFKVMKEKKLTTKNTLPGKAIIQIWKRGSVTDKKRLKVQRH